MNLQVRAAVARSTRTLAPLWPLSSFIAINPLSGHESEHFEAAATTRPRAAFLADYKRDRITFHDLLAATLERIPELSSVAAVTLGGRVWAAAELVAMELVHSENAAALHPVPNSGDLVDEIVAKWIGAYLDPRPLWLMPGKEHGLWAAWRAMAAYDTHLPRAARRRLRNLPPSADAAVERALAELGIEDNEMDAVLREEAESLPGWAAHVKWRADHVGDVDLTTYLAVRLTLRAALRLPSHQPETAAHQVQPTVWARAATLAKKLTQTPVPSGTIADVAHILALLPPQLHDFSWQTAYEVHYRQHLLGAIPAGNSSQSDACVQVVFCIDPRSEGMRRHLEIDPEIETYGFAGFFGVPIRFASYQARGTIDALPALLSPHHAVTETTKDPRRARRHTNALRMRDAFWAAWHAAEASPVAPFALAETFGWFSGAGTLLRTLFPSGTKAIVERLGYLTTPNLTTDLTIADAFTLAERAALAETGIRMMGLDQYAPLVVLTGHGSSSTNNPYQSALDCGACGGNPGAANARSAAAIFNDPDVRGILAGRGLPVPEETFFIAAEHDTVSDRITVLDQQLIPDTHSAAVSQFLLVQEAAAGRLIRERATQLPGAKRHGVKRLRTRADDWAEVYPELGLAGNAAMIIGPREMTRNVDLQRRVFLHSYRPHLDPDGSALESIMTAPLVVAQWINHQYYFSTVDPDRWGAGTKTIHNVIGTIGVLSGQVGDLRQGLPLQSVRFGSQLLHEPMRLSVIIQAPLERVGTIVSRNQTLRHLFDNHWITLTARDDDHSPWYRYSTYGWTPITSPTPPEQGD